MVNKTCNPGNRCCNRGGQGFSGLKSNQFQIERGGGKLREVNSLEKQKELDRLCECVERAFCGPAGVFEEIYQCVHRNKQIKKRSNRFFIEVQLFYNVVLVSALQQSESASRIPIFPLVPPSHLPLSHPSQSSQSTELSSLHYTAGSHYLFHTWSCIHVSPNLPTHPTSLPPTVSTRLFSASVSLFLPCK